MWLPRIIAKARLIQAGQLAGTFIPYFSSTRGMDGGFLKHLEIERADMEKLASLEDQEVAESFVKIATVNADKIENRNHGAPNFGRPGYPRVKIFPIALGIMAFIVRVVCASVIALRRQYLPLHLAGIGKAAKAS